MLPLALLPCWPGRKNLKATRRVILAERERPLGIGIFCPEIIFDERVGKPLDLIVHGFEDEKAQLHIARFTLIDTLELQVDTLCVHGDNPEGVQAIREIRALVDRG